MIGRRGRLAVMAVVAALALPSVRAQEGRDRPLIPDLPRPSYLPPPGALPFQLPDLPPSLESPTSNAAEKRVAIRRIVVRGNTVIPAAELEQIAAPYLGLAITSAELEMLRQTISQHYIERGYLNSGVIFSASKEDGTLSLQAIEGRLSRIRLSGLADLDQRYISERLARAGDGPLNVNVLRERFQLLLDDPLFNRLNARLLPDERLGEAILDIDVERRRPYQLSAFVNNLRSPSIGADVAGLRGWVRNLSGRGDLFAASLQASASGKPGSSYSLNWDVPLNYRGTNLSLHFEKGDSALIEKPINALDIASILESRQVGLSHALIERLRDKLQIGIDYVDRSNRTSLMGAPFSFIANEPSGNTKTGSWRFWQEYSYRTEAQVLALRSTFVSTDSNLHDTAATGTTARVVDPQYRFWLGQARYARMFSESDLQLVVRSTVQTTGNRMLSLDGLAVGGMNSVRGYLENQQIRDAGIILSVELEIPVSGRADGRSALTLAPFYDHGRSHNTAEPSDTLSSAGVAVRGRWDGLSVDLAMARRLRHPDSIRNQTGNLQAHGVHFQVTYDFFAK